MVFFKFLYNRTRGISDGRINADAFVQMHWQHMEELFSANKIKAYRDFMVEHELIEVQNAHAFSKTSTRYRVHPRCTRPLDLFDFSAPAYTRVAVTSPRAIRANQAYKQFKFEEMLSRLPAPYNVLAPLMRHIEVVNDAPEARAILDALHNNPKYKDKYEFDAQLEAIKSRETEYYFACNFGRRFHSQYTSLKKELRQLLRFPGCNEVMAELDIVNSQPWITSIVDEALVKKYVPEAYEEVKHILNSAYTKAADFNAYRLLCANGTVYERWMELLVEHIGDDWRAQIIALDAEYNYEDSDAQDVEIDDRSLSKILFFRVIFAKQEGTVMKNGKTAKLPENFSILNDAFKAEWPSVWQFFAAIKKTRLTCNNSKKEGAHSNLALLMQRIESSIMQAFLIKCLENGINDIVPIYDGALVKQADLAFAKELFLEVVQESGAQTEPRVKG
ncbi:hypothetical protein AUC43_15225 [Hymenobacter sedentarius]|uniref:Uncharacterized protein n=1 Tax=Hymenobacter sedentarius TaxID=1411621 RepID=A0A0U4BRG5_9BACT|nr:hypothetical protein AUC43_15225 [Hymenobacter sedentarius]